MHSERLELFMNLNDTREFEKVKSFYIYNSLIEEYWKYEDIDSIVNIIMNRSDVLPNNRVFVHPCPIDEALNTGYSFAGVYRSYKPYRGLNIKENIERAVHQIRYDRFSFYGDYYYRRNGLVGARQVDLFVSCENDEICGYGTGYVDSQKCVVQYYDSPLAIYRKEPRRIKGTVEDLSFVNDELQKKIMIALYAVQEQVDDIIDVEFVFNRKLNVIINEVRRLSASHKNNWNNSLLECWKFSLATSSILNTVGEIKKRVKIWRKGLFIETDFDVYNEVLCINYESDSQIFELLSSVEKFTNVSLIISYPFFIIDNHFSYVLYEDKTFDFVLRCVNYQFINGRTIHVKSDGLNYSIGEV